MLLVQHYHYYLSLGSVAVLSCRPWKDYTIVKADGEVFWGSLTKLKSRDGICPGRGAGRSKVSPDVSGFTVPAWSNALFGGFCQCEVVSEEMLHTISSTCMSPPNCLQML